MSTRGETFVSEEVGDGYKKELNRAFGKGKYRLHLEGSYNMCDERLFPDSLEIDVLDYETDKKIGTIKVDIRKFIDDNGYGSFIEIEPDGINIYDLKGKEIRN